MKVEIVTIGDEILIGQIVDTNSAWMSSVLNKSGFKVVQISSISDSKEEIVQALDLAKSRADIVLITGGLGPTKDDITKNTLTEYFDDRLVFNEEVFEHVKNLFASFGRRMPDINRLQAEIPSRCTPLHNLKGTAPGMWFDEFDKVFVSMPGVPYEMKYLMEYEVVPRLKEKFNTPELVHRTVLTQGIGESSLMELIGDWENNILNDGLNLAWLPSAGRVRLRISHQGTDRLKLESRIDYYVSQLEALIPEYFVGQESDKMEEVLGKLLLDKNWTMSTAESCTGGYVAHLITSVSGSSNYFEGSVVSYSNRVKESVLGVSWQSLKDHGAVSKQVVEEMALGVKRHVGTDCSIATSGVAGPLGGTEDKPVGTVWIAVATPHGVYSELFQFGKDREKNIERSAVTALRLLHKEILKYS